MSDDDAASVMTDDPIRFDDGKPVYPDWEDPPPPSIEDWSVRSEAEDQDAWVVEFDTEPPEDIVYRPPVEVAAEVKSDWDDFRRHVISRGLTEESLMGGVEKVYSTKGAAEFFGRSNQWLYWGLRPDPETGLQVFTYKNGQPILPERVGKMGKRRFTLPIIREIALSCYRRGQIKEEELEDVMARILLAEFGAAAFADAE